MHSKIQNLKTLKSLLLLALICVCIGRAYQCLFWDIPIRSLLWNEDLLSGIVQSFMGLDWEDYLKHPKANETISRIVLGIGIGLLFFMVMSIINIGDRKNRRGIQGCTFLLLFIAFLYHLEKFRTAGQFFEYSLQFATPVIYYVFVHQANSKSWILLTKICIALTFTSHGLYAIGFYPVPGNFVAMTINILHCTDNTAITFLQVVGILDLIVSVGIFLPGKIFKGSIWYCIIWGALTALARIVANVELDDFFSTMHQWAYQTLYRAPHFLIPLTLWRIYKKWPLSTETES